jgi:site-specific DNA-methyltransferase (adenine-specific)
VGSGEHLGGGLSWLGRPVPARHSGFDLGFAEGLGQAAKAAVCRIEKDVISAAGFGHDGLARLEDATEHRFNNAPVVIEVVLDVRGCEREPVTVGRAGKDDSLVPNSADDDLPEDEYLQWSRRWIAEVIRLLKARGSFFLNYGGSHAAPLLPFRMRSLAAQCSFRLQNTFHWIKSIALPLPGGLVTLGQFRPVPSDRYANDCHEFVFHLTKGGDAPIDRESIGVPYTDKSNLERYKHVKDRRCRGNTWFIPYETIVKQDQRLHPASFPKELARNCIRLHGARRDLVVLDPFLGIGSSALAALDCGAETFIGFDLDEEYVRFAKDALDNATPPLFGSEAL